MLLNSILILIISNAVTLKREKSIFYSRLAIIILIISLLLGIENLYILSLEKGIGLYGGLFHITANIQTFHIFIYIIIIKNIKIYLTLKLRKKKERNLK